MRRTFARITIIAAATVGLAATTGVAALGLGEMDVSSNLNQRFQATIPLTEINAEDLETVTVSIASNEAFDRAGINRAEYLSSLDFQIRNDQGRPRVVVSSSQIAREPVLNLLVQARWSGGKILRDYTVLLDPVEMLPVPVAAPAPVVAAAKPAPVMAAPAPAPAKPAAPVPAPTPTVKAAQTVPVGAEFYEVAEETKSSRPSNKTKPASAPAALNDPSYDPATASYGPVAAGETLWSIASKLRPSTDLTMDQVLLALSEANPVAIQRGTTVSKGMTLRVPTQEKMQATSATAAKARLTALRAGGKAATPKPAPVAAAPTDSKPAATSNPAPKTQIVALEQPSPAAEKPAEKPQDSPADKSADKAVEKPAPASAAASEKPAAEVATKSEVAATPAATAVAVVTEAQPAPAASTNSETTAPAPAPTQPVAAPPAVATAAVPVPPAVAKSPLAQPLPSEDEPGFLSSFGLPLGLGALLLALFAGWFVSKRRKGAATDTASAKGFKPGDTFTAQSAVGKSAAAGRLGDTRQLSGTQVLGPAGASTLAADATQQLASTAIAAPAKAEASHDATMILEPELVATLNSAVKSSVVTSKDESFDRTTQIQVDTLHINLDDNDPISEADFHLAYGLYDEAILLLQTATVQQPQRTDLQVKLAETYFAAGRPMEFKELAEGLKDKLSAAEWSKIAILGAQICPDAALFESAGDAVALDADFDLGFDEPVSPEVPVDTPPSTASGSIDFSLSPMTPDSAALSAEVASGTLPAAPQSKDSLSLDDVFDDDGLGGSVQPAGMDDEASIDFMLGQSLTPLGAGLKGLDDKSLSFNLDASALKVELPKLAADTAASAAGMDLLSDEDMSDRATITRPSNMQSLSLQDLEVSITPRQDAEQSSEDELNTKLDLARAYVEMGDNDMAKSLLDEVQQQGSERHKQEALSLLQRLPK